MTTATKRPGPFTKEDFASFYQECFPTVARWISIRSGTFDDARDIFHDSLIIYCEKVQNKDFQIEISEEAYLFGIAKHLWIKKYKQNYLMSSLSAVERTIAIHEDYLPCTHTLKLLALLENSGQKCMDMLRLFYQENWSLKKIGATLGFRSEHSVAVQKFKCIERLRDTIQQKSLRYEDFFE